jgi:hypothetical protein
MPGLVPKVSGMKGAYFKTKRGETVNTNISGNIEGVLSRSAMKKIIAGSGGGNIYCHSGNFQHECSSNDLTTCLDGCVGAFGDDCQGCAEFPKVYFA